jgi:Uma2 family endonuclease
MSTAPAMPEVRFERGTRMPLEEYLRTMFHPDREYVDGVAEERPVGEWDHGRLQAWLVSLFMAKESTWAIEVVAEVRLQVRKERFRIPDVMVMRAGETIHRFPKVAPLVCVEILSREDTWRRLQQVINDYSAMGCSNIWALDPHGRGAYYCDLDGFRKTDELAVSGTEIRFTAAELFAVLG